MIERFQGFPPEDFFLREGYLYHTDYEARVKEGTTLPKDFHRAYAKVVDQSELHGADSFTRQMVWARKLLTDEFTGTFHNPFSSLYTLLYGNTMSLAQQYLEAKGKRQPAASKLAKNTIFEQYYLTLCGKTHAMESTKKRFDVNLRETPWHIVRIPDQRHLEKVRGWMEDHFSNPDNCDRIKWLARGDIPR